MPENYVSKFDPAGFQDPAIEGNYSGGDYHQVYFGQVLRIFGEEQYLVHGLHG